MLPVMEPSMRISPVEDMVVHFDYDDNNLKEYFMPGEVLKGNIFLHLRSDVMIRRLVVSLKGSARVSWGIHERKKRFTADEVYFNVSQSILDGIFDRTLNLCRGTHEFSFSHVLPGTIPSSFKGVYGSVYYVMRVELETVNLLNSTVISEPFLVLRRPPLPRETFFPTESTKNKRFFNCCRSGQVKVKAGLARWGGIPGESLYVNAEVINYTDREIRKIVASIVMTSVYHAKHDTITFREVISKREDDHGIYNGQGRRWRTVRLDVPPYIPDTSLAGCNIMDVTYTFHFKVEIEGYDLHLEAPVLVGGYPYGRVARSDIDDVALLTSIRDLKLNGRSMETDRDEFMEYA